MFDEDEQDSETEELMQSVFDGIGLDLQGQMKSVPTERLPAREEKTTEIELAPNTDDAELNKLIAQLM